jgi:hypothetical protein
MTAATATDSISTLKCMGIAGSGLGPCNSVGGPTGSGLDHYLKLSQLS